MRMTEQNDTKLYAINIGKSLKHFGHRLGIRGVSERKKWISSIYIDQEETGLW